MYKLLLLLTATTLFSITAPAQKPFRLLSYNIRNGKGMDNKTDYDRTVAVLQKINADVIGLQEVDSMTTRSGGVDVLQLLAGKTNMHAVYGAAIAFQGGKYGIGVLSKEKPLQYYTVPLPGQEEQRVLLVVAFKKYVVFNTHLSLTEADRLASVAIINAQAALFSKPVYLMGDLNAEPSSVVISTLKAQWKQLTSDFPTFPAPAPEKCIDYIFKWKDNQPMRHTWSPVDEPLASDHRPVLVEIGKPVN